MATALARIPFGLALTALLLPACSSEAARTGALPEGWNSRSYPKPDLQAFLDETFPKTLLPGMAVAVVRGDHIVYAGGLGMADLETGRPVTERTPFLLASVSKSFTATSLMQLYEDGAFELDDDINAYLPFPVVNPTWPDTPITFRELLGHTSSINDNWDVMPYCNGAPCEQSLGEFLESYLVPGGELYDATNNFVPSAPGAASVYSNVGYALVGYLVESMAGEPFADYSIAHTLDPLRMEGGWFLSDFDLEADLAPAVPYDWDYEANAPVERGYYDFPDYPDGQLRTDVVSLATFLLAHKEGGRYHGQRILDADTVAMMHTFDSNGAGMGFVDGGGSWIGHNGWDVGCWAEMWWNTETDGGIVMLINGVAVDDPSYLELVAIYDRLVAESQPK